MNYLGNRVVNSYHTGTQEVCNLHNCRTTAGLWKCNYSCCYDTAHFYYIYDTVFQLTPPEGKFFSPSRETTNLLTQESHCRKGPLIYRYLFQSIIYSWQTQCFMNEIQMAALSLPPRWAARLPIRIPPRKAAVVCYQNYNEHFHNVASRCTELYRIATHEAAGGDGDVTAESKRIGLLSARDKHLSSSDTGSFSQPRARISSQA